ILCLILAAPLGVSRVIASFHPNMEEEDDDDDEEDEESESQQRKKVALVAGLSEKDESIRRVLLAAAKEDFDDELQVLPSIDSTLLGIARRQCKVALEDRVLGVMDYLDEGEEVNLVFGCQALYYRNAEKTPHPGTGVISYADLLGCKIINHGDAIYLGND